jgi:hypothetical protein
MVARTTDTLALPLNSGALRETVNWEGFVMYCRIKGGPPTLRKTCNDLFIGSFDLRWQSSLTLILGKIACAQGNADEAQAQRAAKLQTGRMRLYSLQLAAASGVHACSQLRSPPFAVSFARQERWEQSRPHLGYTDRLHTRKRLVLTYKQS